jgi:hypothetical protein
MLYDYGGRNIYWERIHLMEWNPLGAKTYGEE